MHLLVYQKLRMINLLDKLVFKHLQLVFELTVTMSHFTGSKTALQR